MIDCKEEELVKKNEENDSLKKILNNTKELMGEKDQLIIELG